MGCRITDTYGIHDEYSDESGHDERQWSFDGIEALLAHLRAQQLRFADSLARIKEDPESALNDLGPEYVGVAFAVSLLRDDGRTLEVGIGPELWVLVSDQGECGTGFDGPDHGRMVVYFHHWTEWEAKFSFKSETAKRLLDEWVKSGAAA